MCPTRGFETKCAVAVVVGIIFSALLGSGIVSATWICWVGGKKVHFWVNGPFNRKLLCSTSEHGHRRTAVRMDHCHLADIKGTTQWSGSRASVPRCMLGRIRAEIEKLNDTTAAAAAATVVVCLFVYCFFDAASLKWRSVTWPPWYFVITFTFLLESYCEITWNHQVIL